MLLPHIKLTHGVHSLYAITPVRRLSEQKLPCWVARKVCVSPWPRWSTSSGSKLGHYAHSCPPTIPSWCRCKHASRLVEATLDFPPVTSPRQDFGTCTGTPKNAQTRPEVSVGIWRGKDRLNHEWLWPRPTEPPRRVSTTGLGRRVLGHLLRCYSTPSGSGEIESRPGALPTPSPTCAPE